MDSAIAPRSERRPKLQLLGVVLLLVAGAAVPNASATTRESRIGLSQCGGTGKLPGINNSVSQLITVVAPTARSSTATLTLWQRQGGCLAVVGGPWLARTGYNGLSAHHLEGDGTTPIGTYGLGPVLYGALPDPGTRPRYHRLGCGDWWDEDPASPRYNQFVELPCGAAPSFGGDSEALWQQLPAYDYFAVIEYNAHPPVAGRGSAIFLHLDAGSATNGCISLRLAPLLKTLRWIDPAAHPRIVIGTNSMFTAR
jgi:L,D-peptidoglycan transpeptidase YkuD (ErfK/YbiS/YcfS/YnhG family)